MFLALLLGPCLLRPGSDLYRGLSPDLAVFIINIVMSSLFLKWLDEPRSSREASFELSALVVFASVGITLKLSLTSAAAAVVLLAFVLHARTPTSPSRSRARQAAAALIASGILIVPWLARGGILSGYPAYPAEWPSLPVAWKVPKVLVHSMTNWIRSRARQPESHWSQVPDNWDWLAGWWSRLPPEFTKAALLTAGSVFLSLGVLSRPIRGPERNLPEQWLFLIPQLILLASWAALAPDPRFTAGSIWILPAGLLALTWARVAARRGTLSSRIVGGGLCVLLPLFALAPYGTVLIRSPRPTVAATVPLAQTELHETASGLRVHIPIGSNQCWDSPLPCTPYFRRNLSQRKGGDLGSGFYLSAAATCADIHSCEPPGFTTPPTIGVAVVFEDWYPFEEATKLVWMKATGRFLLYVEKPVNVTLSLVPAVIHEQGDFGQQGRLAIRLDGRLLGRFDIAAEQKLEVPLSLRADFNQVTLELEAGSFVPSEHIPDYPDMREFGIAFHEFVLTEERDSGTLPTP
jgi:hypothetical protein